MGFSEASSFSLFYVLLELCTLYRCLGFGLEANQTTFLVVDASPQSGRKIPDTMFGISFEEINHAGSGGLWSELVNNRGFEAGGPNTPSNIDPWSIIGNESSIIASTDRSSCFELNKVALKMEILCDNEGPNTCLPNGVGIYNPGFWGMNIEEGKTYKVVLHLRSLGSVNMSVSLTSSDGSQYLASSNILAAASDVSDWKKVELFLASKGTNRNSRIQLTCTAKGVIWFDQISVMPLDTYKGHGFRKDLFAMLADLKPRFLRFPGGSYAEGAWLSNAFRWKESIGPWEERPGHFNDVWLYWTDDGLGYFEFLQLAEDLSADPVWVFNIGISLNDAVDTSRISPFVKDLLDSIEFATGLVSSTWGSVRAAMGHPEPFDLKYVAFGNQDCSRKNYIGNYRKFYSALKAAYPDIQVITNCDGTSGKLDHPADMYDFHVYTSANNMFSMAHQFDHTSRFGPKAFVSEYAVTGNDAGRGNLLAALAESAFLIGLEINSDVVEMASNAPLFVNANNWRFNPDAIVFNSWESFGTPSYWMQHFFKESSGAIIFPVKIQSNSSTSLIASAIKWQGSEGDDGYLKIKVVNFGSDAVNLNVSVNGLQNSISQSGSIKTILTSNNLMDENSFSDPNKVVPQRTALLNVGTAMAVVVPGHSINAYDLSLSQLVSSQ
uniref:non-reducing end alpha-L-arabinofuranosidase n=1 Tax=Anthurium amnicola TaxID=1678845 RepID=A0A1D1XEK7_9ARAE